MFGAATIIASNYLAFARVLAASFRRFHPGAPFWVLVIDDPDGLWVTADEEFTVLHLGDVGFDGETIHRLAAIYDVLELATAVKPWLLQHLLATTGRPVVYLDPDIEVFSPLDQLAVAAGEHGVAVTPHLLEPLPLDGLYPDDAHMLRSGVHNLGFLAVGPQVLGTSFLPYWQGRTEWMAIVDIQNQLFTDQRWMDWIDCFDHVVIRERGCNVAYWNAWARPITRSGDGWLAGGEPLRFFHFSGFDPANPWILSRHQVDRPRVRLSEHPELAELCRRYASAILAAGHEETSRAPYGWARCGRMELTGPIRRLYRRELMAAVSEHRPGPAGPFEGDGAEFVAWLRSPGGSPRRGARGLTPVGPPVPRLVMAEHERRPDLGAAFPNPTGPTAQAFLEWAAHDEGFRRSTPPELVAALRDGLPSPPELRPGVNIAGYLSAELGVGSVGRLVVEAARAAGLPFATYDHHDTLSRRRHGAGPLPGEHDWRYDINVLCANADSTRGLVGELGQQAADKGRATVAMWHWEAERLPAPVRDAWDVVDEVWVTSRFAFDALVHDATKPLRIFPLPVITTDWTTSLRRADLGLPDGFLVLFCFDWLSVE
ncbi:MAG TPA: hypothetical protein VGI06_00390, partial [Acidimicrobiales bacterium]